MSSTTPKAVLYAYPKSVRSSAVFLALEEKGFGSDEIDIKTVDLFEGQNFSPTYMRINPSATVPSLVVPLVKNLTPEGEVKYQAINDSKAIVEFLDKARSVISKSKTTSALPAPALAPASLDLATTSTQIISLVHSPTCDPNFLSISATSPLDIESKAFLKPYFENRQAAIDAHLASPDVAPKTQASLRSKRDLNNTAYAVYNKSASDEEREVFFGQSKEAWEHHLKDVLNSLEKLIGGEDDRGPWALGDQLSLADMHLMAWLAAVVAVAGGKKEKEGIDVLEPKIGGGWKVGDKVGKYWDAMLERPSFNKVYADGLH